MGRLASAAVTAVAPEARVASAAAGAGRRRRPPASDPRVTAPGSEAARQRQAIEDIKARRPAEPEPQDPAPADPPPASPGGGPSLPAMPAAAATGSGFALGVVAWALGLAYLRGGAPEVKRFVVAKLFNKTNGG